MALADYQARYNFATQTTFTQRVVVALMIAAWNVNKEVDTTPLHTQRLALAKSVQANPSLYALGFALSVLADLGFDDSSSDAALQQEVDNRWNYFLV